MSTIVPHRFFNDYKTWSHQCVLENETLFLKVNVADGWVQFIFLVKEQIRHKDTFQPRFDEVYRSRPYSLSQMSLHPFSLPEWRGLISMNDRRAILLLGALFHLEQNRHTDTVKPSLDDVCGSKPYSFLRTSPRPFSVPQWRGLISMNEPRAVVDILHLGILYGLDYLWEARSENDDAQNKRENILLSSILLPNTKRLNNLCQTLGRKSMLIKWLCKRICSELKTRSSTIIDVWASYAPGEENEVTFMVITKKNCESPRILDRPFVPRCIDSFSTEAAYVIKKENPISGGIRENLRRVVNRHTGSLMQRHTNITLISISSMKSKSFRTGKGKLYPRPCIVIFVHVKGMIPIGEDMLPNNLDGYFTDIREGAFSPFLYQPDQGPDSIKMGDPIQGPGDNVNEDGHVLGGTLGGFIDHRDFGLCCITSAHVILAPTTLHELGSSGWQPSYSYNGTCYQPCPPHKFGKVVLAVVKEGTDDSSGVEVVLIKVEDRQVDEQCTGVLAYRSGEIIERSELLHHMDTSNIEVIKKGAETGITAGKIHSDQTTLRFINPEVSHGTFPFTLRNQIEVLGDNTFAKAGDSGAIVLHSSKNKPLKAIGMLEGGTSYNTFIVTPICEILKSLGLPPPLHMKVFDHIPMETSNFEYVEQRVEHLERTTDGIKKDVAEMKTELQQQGQKLDHIIALLRDGQH